MTVKHSLSEDILYGRYYVKNVLICLIRQEIFLFTHTLQSLVQFLVENSTSGSLHHSHLDILD